MKIARESLTFLSLFLALLLIGALVAPYFIDWSQHRGRIESFLSALIHTPVHSQGSIHVRFLPNPSLTLEAVTIDAPNQPYFTAKTIQFEIGLLPLLRGEMHFSNVVLDSPRLDIPLTEENRPILWQEFGEPIDLPVVEALSFFSTVRLTNIQVENGTLTFSRQGQLQSPPLLNWDQIQLSLQGDSLQGPFKASGSFAHRLKDNQRQVVPVRFYIGLQEGNQRPGKISFEETSLSPRTEIEGFLTLLENQPWLFSGKLQLTRKNIDKTPPKEESAARQKDFPLSWQLTGPIEVRPHLFQVERSELQIEFRQRTIRAIGTLKIPLLARSGSVSESVAQAHFSIQQLDMDRLLLKEASATPLTETISPIEERTDRKGAQATFDEEEINQVAILVQNNLENIFPFYRLTPTSPPFVAEVQIETLLWQGDRFTNFSLEIHKPLHNPLSGKVYLEGPQGARLKLEGIFVPDPAHFEGRIAFYVKRGKQIEKWLSKLSSLDNWRQALTGVSNILGAHSFGFEGPILFSPFGLSSHAFKLDLAQSTFQGNLRFLPSLLTQKAQMFLDISSESLHLSNLPPILPSLAPLFAPLSKTDLHIAFKAKVPPSLEAEVKKLSGGISPGFGLIDIRFEKTDDSFRLIKGDLLGIGGAHVSLTGYWGDDLSSPPPLTSSLSKGGYFKGYLDAENLTALTLLSRNFLPPSVANALEARASALAPARLTFEGNIALPEPQERSTFLSAFFSGAPSVKQFNIQGTLNATQIRAQIQKETKEMILHLENPKTRDLLLQLTGGIASDSGKSEIIGKEKSKEPLLDSTPAVLNLKITERDSALSSLPTEKETKISQNWTTQMQGQIAGTKISFQGQSQRDFSWELPHMIGKWGVESTNILPLFQILNLVTGDSFAPVLFSGQGQLEWSSHQVSLQDISGRTDLGALKGSVVWDRQNVLNPLEANFHLERLSLNQCLTWVFGPLLATNKESGAEVKAKGTSPASRALSAPAGSDNIWSQAPFSQPLSMLPTTRLQLHVKEFEWKPQWTDSNVSLSVLMQPHKITLRHQPPHIRPSRLAKIPDAPSLRPPKKLLGQLVVQRDGPLAIVSGYMTWQDWTLHHRPPAEPPFQARADGLLDFAGTGTNAQELILNLAGSGVFKLRSFYMPQADPQALLRILDMYAAEKSASSAKLGERNISSSLENHPSKAKGNPEKGMPGKTDDFAKNMLDKVPSLEILNAKVIQELNRAPLDISALPPAYALDFSPITLSKGGIKTSRAHYRWPAAPQAAPQNEQKGAVRGRTLKETPAGRESVLPEDSEKAIEVQIFFGLDLKNLQISSQLSYLYHGPLPYWSGPPPQIDIFQKGLWTPNPETPSLTAGKSSPAKGEKSRKIDSRPLLNGLNAQALERVGGG